MSDKSGAPVPAEGVELTTYVATYITELTSAFVAVARSFGDTRPWWRGHREAEWQLVPGLYRQGIANSEVNLTNRFRLMAEARHERCPAQDDLMGWLFLMQHYRLPTRLLDWSESPLVALFFAMEESDNSDGDAAIWAVEPLNFNLNQIGFRFIPVPSNPLLRQLSTDAFVLNLQSPDSSTLAVLPKQSDLRHLVQQSTFTIHGGNVPIEELPEAQSFLARIRIPAASKSSFRELLALYGITRANLFPDLENLAQELQSLYLGRAIAKTHRL